MGFFGSGSDISMISDPTEFLCKEVKAKFTKNCSINFNFNEEIFKAYL